MTLEHTTREPMTHDEAMEFAGLYALDALTTDEKAEVDAHLAACAEDHTEFETLGGVAPALASMAEPMGAPAALKRKVMDDYAAAHPKAWTAEPVTSVTSVASAPVRRSAVPNWMGWAAAGIAIVLLAVLSVVGLNLRSQADQANQRAEQLQQAVAAMSAPGAQVAILHGSGAASDVSGFVAFPANGTGYMVMTDVPAVPSGMTYQAWYIADGQPASAGTMTADAEGNIVASGMSPMPGTAVVAVTVEPAGGSDQPTSDPIIVGELSN
jgi:anti-sigma-K factor RskA